MITTVNSYIFRTSLESATSLEDYHTRNKETVDRSFICCTPSGLLRTLHNYLLGIQSMYHVITPLSISIHSQHCSIDWYMITLNWGLRHFNIRKQILDIKRKLMCFLKIKHVNLFKL